MYYTLEEELAYFCMSLLERGATVEELVYFLHKASKNFEYLLTQELN